MAKKAKTETAKDEGFDSDSHGEEYKVTLDPESEEKLGTIADEFLEISEAYTKKMEELDREFTKLKEPVFEKRDAILAKTEGAWLNVFMNHAILRQLISSEDQKLFKYVKTFKASVAPEESSPKEVYTVTFGFKENPYFTNKVLTKKIREAEDEESDPDEDRMETVESTKIDWKKGMDYTKPKKSGNGKRKHDEPEFGRHLISWFDMDEDPDMFDSLMESFATEIYPGAIELLKEEYTFDDDSDDEVLDDMDDDE
mmetsp:Transcript_23693/g.51736  ORF Transcript_23693/g.51736 Transcript_23693/m.51736 type:complete len:255 (-) Transcript_23693:131-895(-)|eukprot:CAMPEP_0118925982 /NCGR_PEP_ID=MMETSP1169-20130426/3778_1 /TAXON_ID=36882 /ORGANISM="Pyramimonas obovata, Strain CCMP722" /LENGTH=254 /DNA_ID=CAMNT_0006867435 /DNA_START=66 /DNA_END=830 /DNA_ORIENTATION=-